jgi:hypothetical protein
MEHTLEMIFTNAAGRRVTKRVTNAREDVTGPEVKQAMDTIVNTNIFTSTGGDLVGQASARLVTRDVLELEL